MIEFYDSSEKIIRATLKAVEKAKKSVYIQTYIYESEGFGLELRNSLLKKAKQGLRIGLLIDAWGSQVKKDYFKELELAGAKITFFKPFRYFASLKKLILKNHKRNHRKLLIIDNKELIIGSKNIDDQNWQEVALHITGKEVFKVKENYLQDVLIANKYVKRYRLRKKFYSKIRINNHYLLYDRPSLRSQSIRDEHLKLIKKSNKSIKLMQSYFLPDLKIRKALYSAVRRGINVELIVPRHSDLIFFDILSRYLDRIYFKKGIKIYYYEEKIMHTKLMVVDDNFYTLGSSNLDYRSSRYQYETNIFGNDELISKEAINLFNKTKQQSKPYSQKKYLSKPWIHKLIRKVLYKIRKLF